jgi:hypothetical protein
MPADEIDVRAAAPPPGTGPQPAARWPAPRRRPATYPGLVPPHPYLLVGADVHPLVVRWSPSGALAVELPDGTPVDDVLRRHGAAPLAERVPAVAYGANRGPDSLALKFAHHGRGSGHPVPDFVLDDADRSRPPTPGRGPEPPVPVVPVLVGAVEDVDAVGAAMASQGYVYADIVDSPGTTLEVRIPLLDVHQLAAIHDSEALGRAYDCIWLPEVTIAPTAPGPAGGGPTLGAMAYLGRRAVFRVPDRGDHGGDDAGQLLAFAAVAAKGRRFPALTQVELVGRIVATTGVAPDLAPRLGLDRSAAPADVAAELIRLVNGQWWYSFHTGDRPAAATEDAQRIVAEAIAASSFARPPSSPLARHRLTADHAYHPPPSAFLGHRLPR